jgi:hypothetical protein
VTLPAHIRREVQRILDAEARRLLADRLDGDPAGATARADGDAGDRRPDQRSARVDGQQVPVRRGVDA